MANIGDFVLYNEGDENTNSLAFGIVAATPDSNPGAWAYFGGAIGNYPEVPDEGEVLITYLASVSCSLPSWESVYATEGTGPGQYQAYVAS